MKQQVLVKTCWDKKFLQSFDTSMLKDAVSFQIFSSREISLNVANTLIKVMQMNFNCQNVIKISKKSTLKIGRNWSNFPSKFVKNSLKFQLKSQNQNCHCCGNELFFGHYLVSFINISFLSSLLAIFSFHFKIIKLKASLAGTLPLKITINLLYLARQALWIECSRSSAG